MYLTDVVSTVKTKEGWVGVNYDRNLTTKDIAKIIRSQLKREFPRCKFSVTSEVSSITVRLMKANFQVFKENSRYKKRGYKEVNHYTIENDEDLTETAKSVLQRVVRFVNSYNYDRSDVMVDYFDVNFYLDIMIGEWDKPVIEEV